jgi:hypothetical protein
MEVPPHPEEWDGTESGFRSVSGRKTDMGKVYDFPKPET